MTRPVLDFQNKEAWRQWLEKNHDCCDGVYLILYRVSSENHNMRWEEAVQEALCFGWIDSTVKRLDDERRRQLFTPRRTKSVWSKLNKTHIKKLLTENRMHPSGLAKIELAKKDGSWTALEDQNFISTRNVANQKIINLSISYPTRLTKWWNVYASLNAYRSIYEPTNDDFIALSQNTLSFYGQNTFTLGNSLKLEVSGWYSSPSVWGGTYGTKSLGAFNVALQKTFLERKFTLRIARNDLFYSSPWKGNTRFGDLFIKGSGGYDSRQFSVNLSYNFGNKEVKAARKRKTGIENERNRIN